MTQLPAAVVHGHYYQPPRENPWLEEVEAELSAAPFHDWNERIENEAYRAVTAARLPGKDGRIGQVINTLAWTSFNFGPTLLTWLETEAPDTYAAILAADRESIRRTGYGNAIAHPYHHAILPLSTRRDKATEVRWGIRDFRRRFGREPDGMWLPETAVDDETLDVLAEHGIRFTVLAPHQAAPHPPGGAPGLYRTTTGREIALFLYDGGLSHGVAFGDLIRDASLWIHRLGGRPGLTVIATDGETYGHHHKFGEMALARVISGFAGLGGLAAALARHPATHRVTLNAPTSWSCAHGVERWRSECGCKIAPHVPTRQLWRAGLRDALDWLTSEIHLIYQRDGSALFPDPWAARDGYDPDGPNPGLDLRQRELLELERHALLVYTSCAWFFDDLAGLEPVQVLKYAARAIELAGAEGTRLETGFLDRLAEARSNDPAAGTGREIYLARARPVIPHDVRLAGGLAMLASHGRDTEGAVARAWSARVRRIEETSWEISLTHRRTGRAHSRRVVITGDSAHVFPAGPGPASPGWRVGEPDFWDRHRSMLHDLRRRQLVEAVLSPHQRERLASGTLDLASASRDALVEAVGRIATDGSERAVLALELLTQLNQPIPFDAQTGMARVLDAVPSAERAILASLAWRLGFEAPAPIPVSGT